MIARPSCIYWFLPGTATHTLSKQWEAPSSLRSCTTTTYKVYLPVQWLLRWTQPSLHAHQHLHPGVSPQLTCSILLCPLFHGQHSTTLVMILQLQFSAQLAVLGWCFPSRVLTTVTEEVETRATVIVKRSNFHIPFKTHLPGVPLKHWKPGPQKQSASTEPSALACR